MNDHKVGQRDHPALGGFHEGDVVGLLAQAVGAQPVPEVGKSQKLLPPDDDGEGFRRQHTRCREPPMSLIVVVVEHADGVSALAQVAVGAFRAVLAVVSPKFADFGCRTTDGPVRLDDCAEERESSIIASRHWPVLRKNKSTHDRNRINDED